MLEAQRSHRVVAHTGSEYTQCTVNRSMRIAADNDMAGRPQAVFDNDVMKTSVAAVEEILDPVLGRKSPNFVQGPCGLFRRWRKIVIENKGNTRWIENRSATEFLSEHAGDKVRAQVMHDHEVHIRDDDLARRDLFLTARLCENLLNHIHTDMNPT